jgi:tetratricopeptide (TPR) repeat protein
MAAVDQSGGTRVALLMLLVCAVSTIGLRSQESQMRIDGLVQWLAAVERHVPGQIDEPALVVASWSSRDMAVLFSYIRGFFEVIQKGPGASRRTIPFAEWALLRNIASSHAARADPLRFAKRAAMLHADVSIFNVDRTPEVMARRRSAVIRRPSDPGLPQRSYASGVDGRYEGDGEGQGHWDLARNVLDIVRPPEPDPDILLWYRAATAVMMSQFNLAEALPHIRQALLLFPAEPGVQFSWACLHEAFASPRIQRIRQRVHASGGRVDVQDEDENLERAARAYRRVLEIDKNHSEARIRLGRVLDQQDNPRDAAIFLRPRIEDGGSTFLPYYRSLFLGAAETKLGDRAAAESAFREASRLFPVAQSPRLGLALLALSAGNRESLASILAPLRAPAASVTRTDDPWWLYAYCEGRDVDAMVAQLRQRVREAMQ